MQNTELASDAMAAQTLGVATSYLGLSIAMLLGSAILEFIFVEDLMKDGSMWLNARWQILSIAGIFSLVLLGGSLYSIMRAWRNYALVTKLETHGQVTEGTITNRWIDTFEGKPFYRVSYRFQDDLEVWENITEELFEKLCEGCNVPIRYLRYDPTVSRLDYERISAG
jgi:ABC-type multidrug transport system fused ATPase/permease subunit